jgi:uroporphyrinogen decarboxylase
VKEEEWQILRKCADMEAVQPIPIGLIVDSPWIPGYVGVSTVDYLTIPDIWLEANLKVESDFPQIIFLPGFWIEMGMAAEPSGFGCKTRFYPNKTPSVHALTDSVEDADRIRPPHPLTDGLMPIILNLYKHVEPRVIEAGHWIKIVAARGPLATATHLMGVTNFLLGLKLDPKNTHRVLETTTTTAKNWLEAQADVLKNIEGIMLLDDIVGFLSPEDYLEFAHPYLMEIFDAFPNSIKFFHNDMDNPVSYPHLWELSIDIFNFTHLKSMKVVRDLVGSMVCLMGNVPPLEILGQGSPETVLGTATECLVSHPGNSGIILSAGGGVSPGTPGDNILALVAAVERFEKGAALHD